MGVNLTNYLSEKLIFTDLQPTDTKEDFLASIIERTCEVMPSLPSMEIFNAIWQRETSNSTAIGKGIAFPHCRLDNLTKINLSIGICKKGVDYDAPDNQPVHLFFLITGPVEQSEEYLQLLGNLARVMSSKKLKSKIIECTEPAEVKKEIAKSLSIPSLF